MPYSAEVVRSARQKLAGAKADKESKYQSSLQQVYAAVPRIRQIDQQLRQSMALAAQAVFTQGTDAREAMELTRQANLALQQERQRLLQEHFPPDFLDESPVCSHCGGEGYIGTQMCQCLRSLCAQEQKKALAVLTAGEQHFEHFRTDYYSEQVDRQYGASPRTIMEHNFRICRRYAANFDLQSGNLLFVGGTGLGKTFLSACIAAEVAEKGFSVAYESASHLFSKLERARFEPTEENRQAAARLMDSQLLILDDLGTELPGNFVTAALYSLVNDRLLAGLPTIISTNLNVDEIAQRYSPQIASRLQGSFQRLTFVGSDIRILKNRGF